MASAATPIYEEATRRDWKAVSEECESAAPEDVLRWVVAEYAPDLALATGFGVEGCVLVSMLSEIRPATRIFYLDTDLLFPETYALRDQLEARYGVHFERRATGLSLSDQAGGHGERLWERQPDLCCRLRKVEPLKQILKEMRAWITAIRRDQSPARTHIRPVEWDERFGLVKVNPLARWSTRDVWNYVAKHNVPYNPLHDQGYPSIGCVPCTTLVQIGEVPRAGRWRGTAKSECGIHPGR
jgi:phosphoadenosine phosphosulfate reductase